MPTPEDELAADLLMMELEWLGLFRPDSSPQTEAVARKRVVEALEAARVRGEEPKEVLTCDAV